jgi:multidrug resistance efflux pump
MLNISDTQPEIPNLEAQCSAFDHISKPTTARNVSRWIMAFFILLVLAMFLPWTQNIQTKGNLTTLRPSDRPQTIHSTLDGRIERWFVNEGDTVKRGDTIVFLSEIKDDYFDPQLVDRTEAQIEAKSGSREAYELKADALLQQIANLRASMEIKVSEAENKVKQAVLKVQSDSAGVERELVNIQIAEIQFARWDTLYKQDIKSRTDWEEKRNKLQESRAKLVEQENKLDVSRAELRNARLALSNVRNEYMEKMAKAESDRQSAWSSRFEAEGEIAKMENQLSNYERRVGFRYITAPQDGFINKALKPGIGETVKQGEPVVSILPLDFEIAAEMYIRPVDQPLIRKGEKVRLEFDGWPALVFSGWPGASLGTFGGVVYAVETNISDNGMYRVLVSPDPQDEPWPDPLRIGAGANGFALLKDVPLWYELWRQLNGFPPDFYFGNGSAASKTETKDAEKKK